MALPFFYITNYHAEQQEITLDEDNSRHIVQVLRMAPGEQLRLTDGKGHLLTAAIVDGHKKKCKVRVIDATTFPPNKRKIILAISLLKNANRLEWVLEKAAEIGVTAIIPLLCERTERQHFRYERCHAILVSAMLQSQQCWLPILHQPTTFDQLIATSDTPPIHRLIAHCLEAPRPTLDLSAWRDQQHPGDVKAQILIGPEGDFTPAEVAFALQKGYIPVILGENRLRSETAGVVAATLLCIG